MFPETKDIHTSLLTKLACLKISFFEFTHSILSNTIRVMARAAVDTPQPM